MRSNAARIVGRGAIGCIALPRNGEDERRRKSQYPCGFGDVYKRSTAVSRFNGTVDAYGVFTDRSGKVVKRFTVIMKCSWSGSPGAETGLLDEDFSYSDGSKDRRVWTLKRTPEGHYTGTAADVVGEAAGEEKGNAFRWGYTLKLPVESRVIDVQFDDWMYLMSDKILLNKATMSKFGIRLGEVTLSFVKR